MNKKKIIGIIVCILVFALIITVSVINYINDKLRYNEAGATGNTTGNLYNGGSFCEYEGYVYFANANDDNSLYRMKSDGTDLEKLHPDSVSYIHVMNDYIYYIRTNETSADAVLHGTLYGIFRLEIGDDKPERIYDGYVDSMAICGNYIYFRAYDDTNLIEFKSVKVDGQELKTISDADYTPLAVWGGSVYFANTDMDHNLMYIEEGSDEISRSAEGNYYMPTFVNGYFYYIDLDNDMKLTRMSLTNNQIEVMDEGRCINFNVSEENNVIYYQLENEDNHKLCRMSMNGDNITTIAEGDYCNIHITENYTYYYKLVGVDNYQLYRVETTGNVTQQVDFPKGD